MEIVITTGPGHQINFGTSDKPDYKVDGETVDCDNNVAEVIITAGLAEKITKEDEING